MGVRRLRGIEPWLSPLLLMALIFFFSAQPSLDSGLGVLDKVGRKLLHFAEYALLAGLCWRALRSRLDAGRAALVALAIASAYAASDEYHQSFVDGRHGTPVDWAIDTAGAAAAALGLRSRSKTPA